MLLACGDYSPKRTSPTRCRSRSRSRSPSRSPRRQSSSRSPHRGRREHRPERIQCQRCHHLFNGPYDLAHHEVRSHTLKLHCYHCEEDFSKISKLAEHTMKSHPKRHVYCDICEKKYTVAGEMDDQDWARFKSHIIADLTERRIRKHTKTIRKTLEDAYLKRGIGECAHGPPTRCNNFPNCPGSYCFYAHPMCRFDLACTKPGCHFDHTKRPRTCHECYKNQNRHRN